MSRTSGYLSVAIIMLLITISFVKITSANSEEQEKPWEVLDQYSASIFLSPGQMESFHFDTRSGTIVPDNTRIPLPDGVLQAIAKVPEWTQTNLTRTFLEIGNSRSSSYAQLILDCPEDRYLDELAFSISHTSPEVLKRSTVYPEVFLENVEMLYGNDAYIDYADILDSSDSSTIRYWVNESNARTSFDLPSDIYYWYIVHPKVTDEDPTYIDPASGYPSSSGKFWRDWLFYHADSSYPSDTQTSTVLYPKDATPPLLKEVLSGVDTLWNGESYRAPAGYLNNGTGNRRPFDYKDHAVEKISNWVGKTLPLNVQEEGKRINGNPARSVQPVRISRNHYGNCGELQDLTIAAARASLIPARGVLNTGEDHVWSEFWERGWHQWDNFWSDGGSGIDDFGTYDADFQGSWGKELSTVFSWRGDDHVGTVTGNYSNTADIRARVLDTSGRPVDGARVLLATENYYDPAYLTISTWGHTDTNGEVEFDIGDARNFWSQSSSSLGNDPPDSGGNTQVTQLVTNSQTGAYYTHQFNMPGRIQRPNADTMSHGSGEEKYLVNLEFDVQHAYLHGVNIFTDNTFSLLSDAGRKIDVYLADQSNFEKCFARSDFLAYEMIEEASSGNLVSMITGQEHLVLSNMGYLNTEMLISFNVTVYSLPSVLITSPDDGTRVTHTESVEFTGSAHSNLGLENVKWRIDSSEWLDTTDISGDWTTFKFELDTTPCEVGEHIIEVSAVTKEQKEVVCSLTMIVEDNIHPEVSISHPHEDDIVVQGEPMDITGSCWDDYSVEVLALRLDDGAEFDITSSILGENWSWTVDTDDLDVGEHSILVTARDPSGHLKTDDAFFYLTEKVPPDVSILYPDSDAVVRSGDMVTIEGEASDNVKLQSITLFVDGLKTDMIPLPKKGSYWNTELNTLTLPEGPHLLEVRAEDTERNLNSSSVYIVIDGTPPDLDLLSPEAEIVVAPEGVLTVRVSAWDENDLADVRLTFEDGTVSIGQPSLNSTWIMDIRISSLTSGHYKFSVEATDIVGITSRIEGGFNIDDDAPSIYSYTNNMDVFFIGDIFYLNGSVSDRWGISSLFVSMGDNLWNLTDDARDGSYSLSWSTNISMIAPGNYTFDITAMDLVGNEAVLHVTLTGIAKPVEDDNIPDNDDAAHPGGDEGAVGPIILIAMLLILSLLLIIGGVLVLYVRKRTQVPAGPQPPYYQVPPGQYHATLPPPTPNQDGTYPEGRPIPHIIDKK